MTEGTKSYLIGCHQFFFHPLWVLLAWRLEYKSWPKWWETIAVLLHDIGICGRQYLSDDGAKKGHWKLGTSLADALVNRLTGVKRVVWWEVCRLCAGHCSEESGWPESKLSRADKRSRLVAPMWWTWWEYWVEFSDIKAAGPKQWRKAVAENLKREKPIGNHELHIRTRK